MNTINHCLRILKVAYERRNSTCPESVCSGDLDAFIQGSRCETEPRFGTPIDRMLLHLVSASCGAYLQKCMLMPLVGPDWCESSAMLAGFAAMTAKADAAIYDGQFDYLEAEYEYREEQRHAGVPVLTGSVTTYRAGTNSIDVYFSTTAQVTTILSWSGVGGAVRYYPQTYMMVRSNAAVNLPAPEDVVGDEGDGRYFMRPCGDLANMVSVNDELVMPGRWIGFTTSMRLAVNGIVASGIHLEYKIGSYSPPNQGSEFVVVSKRDKEMLAHSIPTASSDCVLGRMLRRFYDHIGGQLHVPTPNHDVLSCLGRNDRTDAFFQILHLAVMLLGSPNQILW